MELGPPYMEHKPASLDFTQGYTCVRTGYSITVARARACLGTPTHSTRPSDSRSRKLPSQRAPTWRRFAASWLEGPIWPDLAAAGRRFWRVYLHLGGCAPRSRTTCRWVPTQRQHRSKARPMQRCQTARTLVLKVWHQGNRHQTRNSRHRGTPHERVKERRPQSATLLSSYPRHACNACSCYWQAATRQRQCCCWLASTLTV